MTENEKELEKSGTYRGFLLYFVLVLPVRRISSDRGNHWFRRYRNTTVQMEENYVARTALSYVAEKVRQHDTSGGVRLTEEEGETVLVLQNTENTTDTDYLTYIYAYDGWLCELVIRDDAPFSKAQGERILEIDTFRLVNEGNGFLRITVSDSGSSSASCLLHLRSSQEHREKP